MTVSAAPGSKRLLAPDLVWHGGRFCRGWGVEVDEGSGRITWVGRLGPAPDLAPTGDHEGGRADLGASPRPRVPASAAERLPGRALLPGFVNAHSHAFQRLIRGRTQWRPAAEPQADFWSWREAMYAAALALSPEDVYHASRFCFLEMLKAGWTSVGEFHYLHRDPDGRRYADPNELAGRVIAAARDVGLRIALLSVCYAEGGIGRPLLPEQRRFRADTADAFLADAAALLDAHRADPLVTVGVAPHSIRAVPRDWLPELHRWAAERELPFHMHVSEQPAEIEASLASYGLRPVELLGETGLLDERFTAVHATHLTLEEAALLGDAGATVCACPTTERDLGDGFLPGAELLDAEAAIALGTDSHTVIDPFEEMRLVEYHERLRRLRRVVLAVPEGEGRLGVAPLLLETGTAAGARSLRVEAGRIETGALADLVAVDLEHPTLAGWSDGSLAAMLALSATAAVVRDVWVGGTRRVHDRRHPLDHEAAAAFRRVAAGTA